VAVLVAVLLGHQPALAGEDHWQVFHRDTGGSVYSLSAQDLSRTGEHVEVWVRILEAPADPDHVTMIRYRLNCRQETFRMVEVVEERGSERSVCTTLSGEIPIRPQKHAHIVALRENLCF
jgi:hypothetical protein